MMNIRIKAGLITTDNKSYDGVEKAVLVGLSAESMESFERSTETSMEELEALLETAGGKTCAVVLQSRRARNPGPLLAPARLMRLKS